ncbi:MAG: hypothetical protein P4N59_03360 [Negativicutes bacterium]|nr:hypothetical protein [Negativicutes bacterium]
MQTIYLDNPWGTAWNQMGTKLGQQVETLQAQKDQNAAIQKLLQLYQDQQKQLQGQDTARQTQADTSYTNAVPSLDDAAKAMDALQGNDSSIAQQLKQKTDAARQNWVDNSKQIAQTPSQFTPDKLLQLALAAGGKGIDTNTALKLADMLGSGYNQQVTAAAADRQKQQNSLLASKIMSDMQTDLQAGNMNKMPMYALQLQQLGVKIEPSLFTAFAANKKPTGHVELDNGNIGLIMPDGSIQDSGKAFYQKPVVGRTGRSSSGTGGTGGTGSNKKASTYWSSAARLNDETLLQRYWDNIDPATGTWRKDSELSDAEKNSLQGKAPAAARRYNTFRDELPEETTADAVFPKYTGGGQTTETPSPQPAPATNASGMSPIIQDFQSQLDAHIRAEGAEATRKWINDHAADLQARGIDPQAALQWVPDDAPQVNPIF